MASEIDIIDNRESVKVVDIINRHLRESKEACFAVGYFSLFGWELIKDHLPDNVKKQFMRILISRELDEETFKEISEGYRLRLKSKLIEEISRSRDNQYYRIQNLKRLSEFIKEGIVDFKIYPHGKLHSKLYLLLDKPQNLDPNISFSPGMAIVGSSNFTKMGTSKNLELNVILDDAKSVKKLYRWFNELWESAEDFREDLIDVIDAITRDVRRTEEDVFFFGKLVDPKTLFKYLVWKWFEGDVEPIKREDVLANFQVSGVINAKKIIDEYKGVIIADSVGLGKSFIGATLIENYILGRYPEWDPDVEGIKKERGALLILPPTIIDQWERLLFKDGYFFHEKNVGFVKEKDEDGKFVKYTIYKVENGEVAGIYGHVAFLSLGIFSQKNYKSKFGGELENLAYDYDLILIDEAHKFRNRGTNRYENARALRYKGEDLDSPRNRFILLTATPINNTIWDIYNLMRLFMDDAFEAFRVKGISVPNLFKAYREAKKKYAENPREDAELKEIAQKIKEDVLNEIMILRTRKYIKDNFSRDGKVLVGDKELVFYEPKPEVVTYNDIKHNGFSKYWEFLKAAEELFPYAEFAFSELYTSGYVKLSSTEFKESPEEEEEEYLIVPINVILKFLLIKRLESSIFAFERSLAKIKEKNDAFLASFKSLSTVIEELDDETLIENLRSMAKEFLKIAEKDEILEKLEEETDVEVEIYDPRARLYSNLLKLGGFEVDTHFRTEDAFISYLGSSDNRKKIVEALREGIKIMEKRLENDSRILGELLKKIDEIKVRDEDGNPVIIKKYVEEKIEVEVPLYNDPKLEKLKRLMQTDLNNRKYIIFTQYKDTANYLYTAITEWAKNERGTLAYLHNNGSLRIDIVTGDTKNKEVKIRRFAPYSNDGDEYDIRNEIEVLISTDALAEGVNLQDADGVVNYDLPWNPMIIVQRIGRVNRIGNEKHIFVKNFLPADEIDTIIGILPRISTKIEDITLLIGKESYILSPDEEIKIETFGEKIKDISKATLSELEEMTSVGDAKIIGEIKNKHEVADMLLRNFVLHELGLRKEDFEEVKELDKNGYPIYTLTDSNEAFLLGEISRAGTKRKVILRLNTNGEVEETTSIVFKELWNKKLADNVNLSEFYAKLEKLKAKLEEKAMEMKSLRASSKGGYLTYWANQLNGYLLNQSLTGEKDEGLLKMVEAVYSRLIVLDDALTSKMKGELRDRLLKSKAIDNNNRIRDYRKFCETVMEFLKFKKGVDLNIRKKVYGWWA